MSVASKLRQFAKEQEARVNKNTRDLAIAIVDAVAEATPVDTGRARSNWQANAGSPENTSLDPYAPGEKLGRGETENLAGVMEAARRNLANYKGNQEPIYITNNTKDPKTGENYIHDLDTGSSRQSAGDFLGVAEAAASGYLKGKG